MGCIGALIKFAGLSIVYGVVSLVINLFCWMLIGVLMIANVHFSIYDFMGGFLVSWGLLFIGVIAINYAVEGAKA